MIEIEVAPGGKTTSHYHWTYAEHFEVLQGTLDVMVEGETRTLLPGKQPSPPRNPCIFTIPPTSPPHSLSSFDPPAKGSNGH